MNGKFSSIENISFTRLVNDFKNEPEEKDE